jgi:hypothetical protein
MRYPTNEPRRLSNLSRRRFVSDAAGRYQDVVVYVWHFVDDARARRKDGAQKEDQEQQMRDLIDALRRGAPREVLLEYTML